jgi:hypothetical protein
VDGDLSGGGSHGRFGAEGPKKAVAPAVISVASLGDNWPAAQAVKTGDGQSFVGSAHRRALALLESSRESFDAAVPALRAFKTGEGDLDHIDIILEALFDRENINQLANYLGPWSRYLESKSDDELKQVWCLDQSEKVRALPEIASPSWTSASSHHGMKCATYLLSYFTHSPMIPIQK